MLPQSLKHLSVDKSLQRAKESRAQLASGALPKVTSSRITLFESNQSKESSRFLGGSKSKEYSKDAKEVQDVIKKRFVRARKDEYLPILDETEGWIQKNPDNFLSQKLLRKLVGNQRVALARTIQN